MKKFNVVFRFDTRGHKKGDLFFTVTTDDHRLIKSMRDNMPECAVYAEGE